jgi:hypothetical protein
LIKKFLGALSYYIEVAKIIIMSISGHGQGVIYHHPKLMNCPKMMNIEGIYLGCTLKE